jgi:hypothetical protein
VERQQFERNLAAMDLGPIKYSLVKSEDGPNWSVSQALLTEKWYRRFHTLIWLYPEQTIVPTKHIDEFWHTHILDTEKYYQDCMCLHGRVVHHFPYLGVDDRTVLLDLYRSTLSLFVRTFNECPTVLQKVFAAPNLNIEPSMCGVTNVSLCGVGCANVRPSLGSTSASKKTSTGVKASALHF